MPFVAVIFPKVAVIDPGATKVEGTLNVIVDPEPTVVISLEVPARVMLLEDGLIAPPDPPVRVLSAPPDATPSSVQLAEIPLMLDVREVNTYTFPFEVLIQGCPGE